MSARRELTVTLICGYKSTYGFKYTFFGDARKQLENVSPPSKPSAAKDARCQFQCSNMALFNKNGVLFKVSCGTNMNFGCSKIWLNPGHSPFNSSSFVFQAVIFSSDDFGRDLPGVEALLRKHDDLERDLTVIEGKMEALESEARRLARSQAHMVRAIQAKQTEIIENWERLNDLFDER